MMNHQAFRNLNGVSLICACVVFVLLGVCNGANTVGIDRVYPPAKATNGSSFPLSAGPAPNPAELVTGSRLPLSTKGAEIVDANGVPVRLACANWYHAHMENYAISGLHLHRLENLTSTFLDFGFNCVRLPFSIELVLTNPVVPDRALLTMPELYGIRGLELLDIVIQHWQERGLMVVLNNHNSKAGWCCDIDSPEGLWSTDEYPAEEWVRGIRELTARYANFSNVVAFDIRNEIHDYEDKIITWGETDDINTDWKVASEAAGAAVQEEQPDMLVIVSGLCFGYDLRPLQANPPELQVDNKLVWTTHSYSKTTWWTLITRIGKIPWIAWQIFFSLGIVGAVACAVFGFMRRRDLNGNVSSSLVLISSGAWAFSIALIFFVSGFIWHEAMKQAGCVKTSDGPLMSGISGAVMLLGIAAILTGRRLSKASDENDPENAAVVVGNVEKNVVAPTPDEQLSLESDNDVPFDSPVESAVQYRAGCKALNALIASVVLLTFCVPCLILALYSDRYELLRYDLSQKWVLQDTIAPIWLGEFGSSDATDPWFRNIIKLLEDNPNLSWAWWPFDGSRWFEETLEWGFEGYGLLMPDYSSVRNSEILGALQTVQQRP